MSIATGTGAIEIQLAVLGKDFTGNTPNLLYHIS